jgi:hypothetical protein
MGGRLEVATSSAGTVVTARFPLRARRGVRHRRGGLQRELVERQRPRRAGADDEGDASDRAVAQGRDHVAQALGVLRPPEGQRAPDGLRRAGAEGEHERVVGEALAVLRFDDAFVGEHAGQRVAVHRDAAVGADGRQREALRGRLRTARRPRAGDR